MTISKRWRRYRNVARKCPSISEDRLLSLPLRRLCCETTCRRANVSFHCHNFNLCLLIFFGRLKVTSVSSAFGSKRAPLWWYKIYAALAHLLESRVHVPITQHKPVDGDSVLAGPLTGCSVDVEDHLLDGDSYKYLLVVNCADNRTSFIFHLHFPNNLHKYTDELEFEFEYESSFLFLENRSHCIRFSRFSGDRMLVLVIC